jgi:signal transduction histidine kinase
MSLSSSSRRAVLFVVATLVIVAITGMLITWLHGPRELATIPLFVPLLGGYLLLSVRGCVAITVALSLVRVLVEAMLMYETSGRWHVVEATLGSLPVVALYVVLAVMILAYRRRQEGLTRHLIEAKSQQVKNEVSAVLAHDFNNILGVITGTSQLLARNPSLNEQAARDVRTIVEAGRQGVTLVEQMREISRTLSAGAAVRDLSELVEREMGVVERILPPEIRTVRWYTDRPLPVLVDLGQFTRMLINLCVNARDAMEHGGVLTVRTEARTVGERAWAALTISDTGEGIAAGDIERIFEPFFTTRTERGGTGLGLSIVKGVVESHGGRIDVRSARGAGTTFTVVLPLHSGEPPRAG